MRTPCDSMVEHTASGFLQRCHFEPPLSSRALSNRAPSTRGFGFARAGVVVSARVGGETNFIRIIPSPRMWW